jgi:predicted nucleic acid-binding protein
MTVVSDTSPINYLVLIGLDGILPRVFSQVLIPGAVLAELQAPGAPREVREWIASPNDWLRVETAGVVDHDSWGLDRGECEVITLAKRRSVKLVLLDERRARRAALEHGLLVAGTLGVLDRAAAQGIVDMADALKRLQHTSFRASPGLIRSLTRSRK